MLTQKQSGFSLIEVMVAVSILGVGLLALSNFNGQLYRGVSHSATHAQAQAFAQQAIDFARSLGSNNSETAAQFKARLDAGLTQGASDCSSSALRRYWSVALLDAASGLKSMSANVCWTDQQGQEQVVAFSAYIATTLAAPAPTAAPTAAPTPIPPLVAAWNPYGSYAKDEKVSFDGKTYMCTKATGCKPPADPTWTPAVHWGEWAMQ